MRRPSMRATSPGNQSQSHVSYRRYAGSPHNRWYARVKMYPTLETTIDDVSLSNDTTTPQPTGRALTTNQRRGLDGKRRKNRKTKERRKMVSNDDY